MITSIVLVAYHSDRWLGTCLKTLARASSERQHLLLVDNSGNTVIEQMDLSPFEAEILTTPRPMGFAEANNFALVHASHLEASVLLLNQDTISPAGWVDTCLSMLRDDSRIAILTPLIRNYNDTNWDPSFLDCLGPEQRRLLDTPQLIPTTVELSHVPAPAMLIRTSVLRKVGPFDPIFGSYYEDYDLCMRVRRAEGRIVCALNARIQHFSGSSTNNRERERRRMRQVIRNKVIHDVRQCEGNRILFVACTFLISLPRRLARGILRRAGSQPVTFTFLAGKDLIGVLGRLLSRSRDELAWQKYLKSIKWNAESS